MKTLLILLFALISVGPLFAQDLPETMENADMSDGTTHWHGNCKVAGADMSTDFITNGASQPKGILIDLRSSSWTKVTQEIHGYKGNFGRGMILTIQYQVSPDFKLSTLASDYNNIGPALEFGGASLQDPVGEILAFVDMPPASRASASTANYITTYTIFSDIVACARFTPNPDQSTQTFAAPLHPPRGTQDDNPTFCIAFPPGHGSITITKISLVPGTMPEGGGESGGPR